MNRNIAIAIKVVVFMLLLLTIYLHCKNVSFSIDDINFHKVLTAPLFWIVVFLSPLNIFLDAVKWKAAISPLYSISKRLAYKASFMGTTLGIFTPNRVGEYGGKLLVLPDDYKLHSISYSLVSSISQYISTFSIGSICFLYLHQTDLLFDFVPIWINGTFLGIVLMVMSGIYFNVNWLAKRWFDISFLRKINLTKRIPVIVLLQMIVLSVLRYFVFTAQNVLLFQMFEIDVPVITLIAALGMIFLLQTITPYIELFGLLIKGNIALLVLSMFNIATSQILVVVFIIWILNLFIPALIGWALLPKKIRFKKVG